MADVKYVVLDVDGNGSLSTVSEGPTTFFIDNGLLGDLPEDLETTFDKTTSSIYTQFGLELIDKQGSLFIYDQRQWSFPY